MLGILKLSSPSQQILGIAVLKNSGENADFSINMNDEKMPMKIKFACPLQQHF